MTRTRFGASAIHSIALVAMFAVAWPVQAQDAKTAYPAMAPLEQYLMPDRNEEIKLARSAAPDSISAEAEVLVLGKAGYETAVPGKNGFVCLVERSWTAGINAPDFWNPKLRGPLCLNPPAVRSYLPRTIKKTELVIAGRTKAQMFEAVRGHRQEGAAGTGARRDVLHALEAGLFGRPSWRTVASASNVFHSRNRFQSVGRGSSRITDYHLSKSGGAPDRLLDSGTPLVGWYARSHSRSGCALALDRE